MDITDSEAERLLLAPPKINEDQDPFNEVNECSFIKIQFRNIVWDWDIEAYCMIASYVQVYL